MLCLAKRILLKVGHASLLCQSRPLLCNNIQDTDLKIPLFVMIRHHAHLAPFHSKENEELLHLFAMTVGYIGDEAAVLPAEGFEICSRGHIGSIYGVGRTTLFLFRSFPFFLVEMSPAVLDMMTQLQV